MLEILYLILENQRIKRVFSRSGDPRYVWHSSLSGLGFWSVFKKNPIKQQTNRKKPKHHKKTRTNTPNPKTNKRTEATNKKKKTTHHKNLPKQTNRNPPKKPQPQIPTVPPPPKKVFESQQVIKLHRYVRHWSCSTTRGSLARPFPVQLFFYQS